MIRIITILLVTVLVPLCAFAGPPILTNDTGTPGPGKWEVNIGFTVDKRHDESRYETPALDLNYGIGEHIQLNYSISWIVLDRKDEGTKNGLGNSEVAIKWRFIDEDRRGIAVSVYPRLIFNNPTDSADRGIVDKGAVFRLPFQMEKRIGVININTEIGHDFHQRGSDEWLYGLVLKYTEIKGLEVLAEVFGTANNSFRRHEVVVNIGARLDLSNNYTLLASLGRRLHHAADQPTLLSSLGLQLRF